MAYTFITWKCPNGCPTIGHIHGGNCNICGAKEVEVRIGDANADKIRATVFGREVSQMTVPTNKSSNDFSFVWLVLRWIWTFPAGIVLAMICGAKYGQDFQYSDNYPLSVLIFVLLFGGIAGFIVEFTIRMIISRRGK